MLVHICCGVDSHYFLQKLQIEYPNERLIGFFYDPNIHPFSEYYLRLLDVQRSCKMLGIELIEGDYDVSNWLNAVRGLENEPEKGARCAVCFDRRFAISAQKARELGEKIFTSTLLTSPKKSLKQLQKAGDLLAKKEGITFVAPDYRTNLGTQEQNILAKKDALYRQDYCGCLYGLKIQREQQDKLADELSVPLSRQIQPDSIEERIELYHHRLKQEEQNRPYKIVKQRFLNWRLGLGYLKVRKESIGVHFLPYSSMRGGYSRGKIEYSIEDIHYLNRDEVKFITLKHYNTLANTNYLNIKELIYHPPKFEKEVEIRELITKAIYDLSAILIVEEIPTTKVEIVCQSKIYSDVRELFINI